MYRIWVKHYAIQNFHEPKSVYSVKICRVTACIAHSSHTVGKNSVCFSVVNCVHILSSSRLREMYLLPCGAWDLCNMDFSQMVVRLILWGHTSCLLFFNILWNVVDIIRL
jgi:hypothetical protein